MGVETEDSEDRLESSVSVLVSLRETKKLDEQEDPVDQDPNWIRKLSGAMVDHDPKELSNRERAVH